MQVRRDCPCPKHRHVFRDLQTQPRCWRKKALVLFHFETAKKCFSLLKRIQVAVQIPSPSFRTHDFLVSWNNGNCTSSSSCACPNGMIPNIFSKRFPRALASSNLGSKTPYTSLRSCGLSQLVALSGVSAGPYKPWCHVTPAVENLFKSWVIVLPP